jgi:hypothetical protein
MKQFLSDESLERLKGIMSVEEWGVLREQALRAWNNQCSDKICLAQGPSPESLQAYASELRYGVKSLDWFFNKFVPDLMPKQKIDKKKN